MSAAVSEAVTLLEGRCAAIDKHYERFPDTADRTMEDTAKAIRLVLAALQEGSGVLPASPSVSIQREGSSAGQWPSVEAFRDSLWDYLSSRAAKCEATALTHVPNSPARHYTRGRSSAFLSVASDLCNGPEWFAAQLNATQVGMSEANAPQPSPEPRDREGRFLLGDIDREMYGRQRGFADVRGELLFRCRDFIAAVLSPKNTESEHD